jgi:hypothetical protein
MSISPAPLPGAVLVASPNVLVRERIVNKMGVGPVYVASGRAEALAKLDSGSWQTLILDRQIPDFNAEELMEMTALRHPGIRAMLVDSSQEGAAEVWRQLPRMA